MFINRCTSKILAKDTPWDAATVGVRGCEANTKYREESLRPIGKIKEGLRLTFSPWFSSLLTRTILFSRITSPKQNGDPAPLAAAWGSAEVLTGYPHLCPGFHRTQRYF